MSFLAVAILLVLVVIAFLYWVKIQNTLVSLEGGFKNAFSQIDVQLKRRYDLIPNLVSTAKAYLKHEENTLVEVTKARNAAVQALEMFRKDNGAPDSAAKLAQSEQVLAGALKSLNIQIEKYPELKANSNILSVQEEITSTENKIAFARQAYNDSVTEFNIYRKKFPNNIIAPLAGYNKDAGLLEFSDHAVIQEAPKVNF